MGVTQRRPVDQHPLRADARPLDVGHADAAVMARANGIEHARVGDGGGVAFALQLEFRIVDAARHVGCEHEEKVHLVGGRCNGRPERGGSKDHEQQGFDRAHPRSLTGSRCCHALAAACIVARTRW